jgi:DNA-binding NarL/FixJ family response regulator
MLVKEATLTLSDGDEADIVIADTLHDIGDLPTLLVVPASEVTQFVREGAVACLPDTLGREDLLAALYAASRGLAVTTASTLADLADDDSETRPGLSESEDHSNDEFGRSRSVALTERERQVLALLAEGESNKAIARRLGISLHTTKFHVASLLAKLGATGRTDAVAQAIRIGALML